MAPTQSGTPELAIPVSSLAGLRSALVAAVGSEAAAQALRQAGYSAGDAFLRILAGDDGAILAEVPADLFWQRLSRLFSARGWGTLSYAEAHSGVGTLESSNWVEAATGGDGAQPSCHFTTGILANVLGRVVGGEVAVLEVECRSRGDTRCRFAFGGAEAVYTLYERINAGASTADAFALLG